MSSPDDVVQEFIVIHVPQEAVRVIPLSVRFAVSAMIRRIHIESDGNPALIEQPHPVSAKQPAFIVFHYSTSSIKYLDSDFPRR